MLQLDFTISGGERVTKMLLNVANRCQNLGPAWELIHDDFLAMEEEQFSSQGKGGWDPWTDDYREWRAKQNAPSSRLMEWDGKLRQSLTEKGVATSGHVFESGPMWAKYGTDVTTKSGAGLGLSHHYGYKVPTPYGNPKAKSKSVEPRKLIELDEAHKREWVRLIQGYIMQSRSIYPEHFG